MFFPVQSHAQAPPYEWVRNAGGDLSDSGQSVAVDLAGDVYLAGLFQGNATFGSVSVTGAAWNTFVAKMTPSGAFIWVAAAPIDGSSGAIRYARGVAVDAAGAVYACGVFGGTISFGSIALSSGGSQVADFVVKYSTNGSPIWARSIGGEFYTEFYGNFSGSIRRGIAVGSDGSVHVVGSFVGTANFGGTNLTSASILNAIYHAKFDANGNLLWATKAGGGWQGVNRGYAVAVDGAGNSFVAGHFEGPANFGTFALPGNQICCYPQYPELISPFLVKYDRDGNAVWARQIASPTDAGVSVAVAADADGNCYVTGSLIATPDYDHRNNPRIFLAKYSAAGDLLWAIQAPSSVWGSAAQGIAADSLGNAFIVGRFLGTTTFGTASLSSSGDFDIFLGKFSSSGTRIWLKQAGLAFQDEATAAALDGVGNLYVTGMFTDSANFDSTNLTSQGAADIFIAKLPGLVPVPPSIASQPQSQTVPVSSNATFSVIASGAPPLSYQWQFNGTNLLAETNSLLAIANAQANNQGNYRVVVSNTSGSATSLVVSLTIAFPPAISAQPLSQTVVAGMTAAFSVGATGTPPFAYQWQFNGNLNVPGGTQQTLVLSNAQPLRAGSYAVIVTNSTGAVTSSVANLVVVLSLSLGTNGSGSILFNPALTNFLPNTLVTLTAVSSPGFNFAGWSGDAGGTNDPLTILMDTNKSITANFAFSGLILNVQGDGTISKLPDKAFYSIGDLVTLTAAPGRWFAFTRWADNATANPRVITIGTSNSFTAVFSPTTILETVTLSNVSRVAPVGMPAILVDGQFVVTGSVMRLDSAEISLITTFPNGSIFYALDASGPEIDSSFRLYSGPYPLRRSATLLAIAYDANFTTSWEADPVEIIIEPTYLLSATTSGGGTIGVSPTNATYRLNAQVTMSANPMPGWKFLGWLGDTSGSDATNVVVMTKNTCVQALFGTTFATNVAGGGSVIVDPQAAFYPFGTVVRLTAMPQAGSYLAAWGNAASSTENPLLFTITNPAPVVSCLFAPLTAGKFALTLVISGRGCVVRPSGNQFNNGQTVTLTALADAAQSFLGWTNDGNGSEPNLPVIMNKDKTITANFTAYPALALGPCLGGVRDTGFRFTLTGQWGTQYEIDGSADLVEWSMIGLITNTFGAVQFTDTQTTNRPYRFYRAVAAW